MESQKFKDQVYPKYQTKNGILLMIEIMDNMAMVMLMINLLK